jgi:hypothetical protein
LLPLRPARRPEPHGTPRNPHDALFLLNDKSESGLFIHGQGTAPVVQSDNPPLRLPLGKIALATLMAKLESVWQDVEMTRGFIGRVQMMLG